MNRRAITTGLVTAAALVAARPGYAQNDQPEIDIEIPTVVLDTGPGNVVAAEDTQLDLANVVQSAAKGVTTVQEAPVIVTVITSDEIADRQYSDLEEVYDTVPGWMRMNYVHQFHIPLVRGQAQAVQYLQDGLSLFDPMVNIPSTTRMQPLETIKRIEMITGPGGVLWGSTSLVGILNLITKDADDVDGVEVGGRVGDGNGDRANARAYVMYGNGDLAHGAAKVFLHAAVDSFEGAGYEMPNHMFSSPLPQPSGPIYEGPVAQADPPRSLVVTLDGKLTLGKLQLRFQAPFGERHLGMGFPGDVIRQNLGEDTQTDASGQLLCPPSQTPDATDQCVDRGRRTRDNQLNYFDRFAVAEYRSRLAHGKAGISIKGYVVQFVRDHLHVQVLPAVPSLLEGGIGVINHLTNYRVGGAVEGDVELTSTARLLYGAEAFNEFYVNNTDKSRQGAGIESTFIGPEDLSRLPTPCPRTLDVATGQISFVPNCPLTIIFAGSRSVLGAYVDPQWRPSKKLILDAGARVSYSPKSLGVIGYDPNITTSGTAVYGFAPGWHIKLNFAQGFRPAVFNAALTNGEAVSLKGSPDLKVETSQAEQGEINARIFKGERRIRELSFRADYSYTTINNFIQFIGGRYVNSANRGISSAEFLGKLYLQGGHRLELGYTWLRVDTEDRGTLKALPENWFNLAAVFNLVDGKLTATTNLRVVGSMEDPNRMSEYRDTGYDAFGRVVNVNTMTPTNNTVLPSELVLDRLPPTADIQVGVAWTPTKRMRLTATAFNALNGKEYYPDVFGDFQPRLEFSPMPMEDFRAYLQATYQY